MNPAGLTVTYDAVHAVYGVLLVRYSYRPILLYAYLGHPSGKTALPFVVSITVQVGIEQDEIDVPLQQIETSLLRALFLFS